MSTITNESNYRRLHVCRPAAVSLHVRPGCDTCRLFSTAFDNFARRPENRWITRNARSVDMSQAGATVCHRSLQGFHTSPSGVYGVPGQQTLVGTLTLEEGTHTEHQFKSQLKRLFPPVQPFEPLDHQRGFVEEFSPHRRPRLPKSLLLGFTLGSGKTNAALHLCYRWMHHCPRVSIVCPLTLIGQWEKSIRQHREDVPASMAMSMQFDIMSYEQCTERATEDPALFRGQIVLIDEAHHYKNQKKRMQESLQAFSGSVCTVLLTATPVQNRPVDIEWLLRLWDRPDLLAPAGSDDSHYTRPDVLSAMQRAMMGTVALYDPQRFEDPLYVRQHYAQTAHYVVYHTITWPQVIVCALFHTAQKTFMPHGWARLGSTNSNKSRGVIMNAYTHDSDQVFSSKISAVLVRLRQPGATPAVVYSGFKKAMLEPLRERIQSEMGLRAQLLTGDTRSDVRQSIIDRYNGGKLDVLIICRVGGEGIDLTRASGSLHILEPQNHLAEENQIIGRVVRYQPNPKKVNLGTTTIQRYVGQFPSIDELDSDAMEFFRQVIWADNRLRNGFLPEGHVNIDPTVEEVHDTNVHGHRRSRRRRVDPSRTVLELRSDDTNRCLDASIRLFLADFLHKSDAGLDANYIRPTVEELAYRHNQRKAAQLQPIQEMLEYCSVLQPYIPSTVDAF